MTDTMTTLLQTPFHAWHLEQGGKMVPFAGWEMPLHYGSILEEHHQVRRSGGIFDVSHMGRLMLVGRDARRLLDRVCTRQIIDMQPGQARYSIVCNELGGCHDDVLVYLVADGEYLMVCNASNRAKIVAHLQSVKDAEGHVLSIEDFTERSAMLALQGPKVMEVMSEFSRSIPELKRYRFLKRELLGLEMFVSRTGYTGEDGVEVIFRTDSLAAKAAIKLFMSRLAGIDAIRPAGLGARDSLRLEASMALYGHEITEELDPVSAGLMFAIKIDKGREHPEAGRFIGQDALERIHAEGPRRRLVGLQLDSRRAARQGAAVHQLGAAAEGGDAGDACGEVTSGTVSPTLGTSIAMAYVDAALAEPGTRLAVPFSGRPCVATVVPMPFYKPGS